MQELKSADKVVQQMTRDGVVEVNKTTGGAERISGRTSDASPAAATIGGVISRVEIERKAAKKRRQRKSNQEIFNSYYRKPETTRLQFTDAERADPSMSKAIQQSDQAADRYEKARARVPTKPDGKPRPAQKPRNKSPTNQRVSDKPQGKDETRLSFRENDRAKPPNGKLTHALERPTSEAANLARNEVRKHEGDNTGVQAVGFSERTARGALRTAGSIHSRLKFEPQKKLLHAEKKAMKANVNALYKRDLRRKPELAKAGILKKAAYKRRLKRNYAKAFQQGIRTGQAATATLKKGVLIKTAVVKAALAIKMLVVKAAALAAVKTKLLLTLGGLFFILILLAAGISSCMSMFGGGITTVISTSFTAEDEDILGADEDYIALQNALAERIANIPNEYPDFDEFRFTLDPIEHDPFALASYLTAVYMMYTRGEVQGTLAFILEQQYTLTLTPIIEIRTRQEERTGTGEGTGTGTGTGIDDDGYPYTYEYTYTYTFTYTYMVTVEYNWYVLIVVLVNHGIEAVASANLTPEQLEMFHVYMETRGNRPELFP